MGSQLKATTRAEKQKDTHPAQGGFTLIEILVAGLLLLLVLIPALGMMISSLQASLKSETQNAATLLAQEQIEELRTYDYDALLIDESKLTSSNATALGLQEEEGTSPPFPYTYTYGSTSYNYLSESSGTIEPVEQTERRNVTFTIHRYILEVSGEEHRKVLVRVSWTNPTDGEMVFETDIQEVGISGNRPPVVNILYPYYGDAFPSWNEITPSDGPDLKASATDPDGTVQSLEFQYKKNVDANFNRIADGVLSDDGYYTADWTTNIASGAQYNFRAVATDNKGATSVETIPFFLDADPPAPPDATSITVTNVDDTVTTPLTWPPKVSWEPVYEYIGGNSNFNMVIGYLVYRDYDPDGTNTPVATLYGDENTTFIDTGASPNTTHTYSIKSMGRADAWRTPTGVDSEVTTDPFQVDLPDAPVHAFEDEENKFTRHSRAEEGYHIYAVPTSWSAISLEWEPQQDLSGDWATLYVIERNPDIHGKNGNWTVVATVEDPASDDGLVTYVDRNLERETPYDYRIAPVVHTEQPPAGEPPTWTVDKLLSDRVTTEIY